MVPLHYMLIVCAALAAGLPNLADALPPSAGPWLKGLTACLVLLTGVLGAISPQVAVQPPPQVKQVKP